MNPELVMIITLIVFSIVGITLIQTNKKGADKTRKKDEEEHPSRSSRIWVI